MTRETRTDALDLLIPAPGRREVDSVELGLPLEECWDLVRHADLADAPGARVLFGIRTLPGRILGRHRQEEPEPLAIRLDDLVSTPEHPGFAVLVDDPPYEVAVGAIGKVWKPDIPFVHVPDPDAFAAFDDPGWVRVAWALRLVPLDERTTRLEVEVRVDATDPESWKRFRRYFHLIGPGSHFIRHRLLAALEARHGVDRAEHHEPLPGDDLLPDARYEATHGVTVHASPEAIWPWLVQMGCRRAGYYSLDLIDNAGRRSAREVHPELQDLAVGDVIPATPDGDDGFEVLRIERARSLVFGGLFDPESSRQLPFDDSRPSRYWHVTWAFVLQPRADGTTRLVARGRAAFDPSQALHAQWMRAAHHLMESVQLRHLAARAEGRIRDDDVGDVAAGLGGAAVMAAAVLTPFLRPERSHWGLSSDEAARELPGDDLVPRPRWQWTHAVEVEAPAERVWPWVAQVGADRAGFYSYQWLENVAGCDLRNAESIHPEWELHDGDALLLHPDMPALPVARAEPGRFIVAHAAPDPGSDGEHGVWAEVSWLFLVEPLGGERCRVISRYRCATSERLAARLRFGPALVEPVSFAMDRRMLLGIKERAEQARTGR